ncbi:hypothetical protein L2E82_49940 [Cichorium intybus]|nr:hypothetical protein L2E82_49940 [Cichorium intybus]
MSINRRKRRSNDIDPKIVPGEDLRILLASSYLQRLEAREVVCLRMPSELADTGKGEVETRLGDSITEGKIGRRKEWSLRFCRLLKTEVKWYTFGCGDGKVSSSSVPIELSSPVKKKGGESVEIKAKVLERGFLNLIVGVKIMENGMVTLT